MTKMLYYQCRASSWRCHFLKKHNLPMHMRVPIDLKCNMHAQDTTILTNVHFCSLKSLRFQAHHRSCVNKWPKRIHSFLFFC